MASQGYRDYFKILGLDRNASADDVKRAFRKLARQYHPDVNPGDNAAESKFKEISEAYEVLSDPQKRSKYEQFGKYWDKVDPSGVNTSGFDVDFGRYSNFDEFITDLLGNFGTSRTASPFSSGFPKSSSRPNLNLDAEINLKISFSEAFHGSERTLSVNKERVQVRIPPGVKAGSRLRLKDKGNFQPGTGKRGDLYLNLDIQTHSIWHLNGNDLCADLPVCCDELLLGATVSLPTPDGFAKVNIPKGTLPGCNLRLKGKGWPSQNGRGDLILKLSIDLSADLSSEELKLIEEFQRIRSYNPRESWIKEATL